MITNNVPSNMYVTSLSWDGQMDRQTDNNELDFMCQSAYAGNIKKRIG